MSDLIERRAVLDGLASIAKVKARSDAQKAMMGRCMFFVEQLPSVQRTSNAKKHIENALEDAISRRAVISTIYDNKSDFKNDFAQGFFADKIRELSPVTVQANKEDIHNEQWQELKETIIELRDNDGTGTQQEVCKFLANLMDVLEEQMSCTEKPNKSKFEFDEEQEQIDFVQPHKKIEVNLVIFDTPYTDAISRQAAIDAMREETCGCCWDAKYILKQLPSVSTEKTGHCKDCKYFEYDSVAKVDGIPLIVAHEICSKWGEGCKTKEDGYCFLFEPKEED